MNGPTPCDYPFTKTRCLWHRTPLCRKLHRVPPLHHILDFFTLVNLMNQFRSVIDQTHRRFARHTGPAQTVIRFLEIAAGSWFEAVSQLKIARNQNFLNEPDYRRLCASAEELVRRLSGLRQSLRESPA